MRQLAFFQFICSIEDVNKQQIPIIRNRLHASRAVAARDRRETGLLSWADTVPSVAASLTLFCTSGKVPGHEQTPLNTCERLSILIVRFAGAGLIILYLCNTRLELKLRCQ